MHNKMNVFLTDFHFKHSNGTKKKFRYKHTKGHGNRHK